MYSSANGKLPFQCLSALNKRQYAGQYRSSPSALQRIVQRVPKELMTLPTVLVILPIVSKRGEDERCTAVAAGSNLDRLSRFYVDGGKIKHDAHSLPSRPMAEIRLDRSL